jgi:hypothetical protein
MVLKWRPLTDTVTVRHLTCGRFRSRNVRLCPLTQTFVDGRMKADAAEIGGRFDLPDATVAAAIAVAIATIVTETAPHRVIRLN